LKTVLALLWNDLKRDAKRPWFMVLLASLPLVLSFLIASVFGGKGGSGPAPTIHLAVLDEDKDLLSRLLRSLPTQGENANRLQLHFVKDRAEGFRLVEKQKVSALLVLPPNLTADLLAGRTNSLELYENPAQQVLPRIVRQGVSLVALGLSSAAETLGEPLRDLRDLIQSNDFPAENLVTGIASDSVRKLGRLRTYVFPPLVQMKTVAAADFVPAPTQPTAAPPPR
jgi:hypothetical protein